MADARETIATDLERRRLIRDCGWTSYDLEQEPATPDQQQREEADAILAALASDDFVVAPRRLISATADARLKTIPGEAAFVFEGKLVKADVEDGGQAKITEIDSDGARGLFVRVQSWDETKIHEQFAKVDERRVRITIEVLGE